jgi:hypothetical protein
MMRSPVSASASGAFGVTMVARAMRRHHHGVDDKGERACLAPDRIGNRLDDAVVQEHAGLDAVGAKI